MKAWLALALLRVDEWADGVRIRLLFGLSAVLVLVAPLWDTLLHTDRLAGNLEPFSLAATLAFLVGASALAGGRMVALAAPEDGSTRGVKLRQMLRVGWRYLRNEGRLLGRQPGRVQALVGAGMLCVVTLTMKNTVGLFRWFTWKGLDAIEWAFDMRKESLLPPLRWLLGLVYKGEQLGMFVVMLATAFMVLVLFRILLDRSALGHSQGSEAAVRDLRHLQAVRPVLQLSDARARDEIADAFHGELVRRLFADLSAFTPPDPCEREDDYRDALAFYLQDRGYQVSVEKPIRTEDGRRRLDLVVEDRIAVELKHRLHDKPKGEEDRAMSQIQAYARAWSGRGPVVLLLGGSDGGFARRFEGTATGWNAGIKVPEAAVLVTSHG